MPPRPNPRADPAPEIRCGSGAQAGSGRETRGGGEGAPGGEAGPGTGGGAGPGEPAGLYLHVPFCSAVCPYCDFAVQVGPPALREGFVDALLLEIALWGDWRAPIDSVYFGGGTPSLLTPSQLGRLLDAVRTHLPVRDDAGVFLEANPEDVDAAALRAWRAAGVSTLSLGVQSFDDRELRFLGRRHDAARAREAVARSVSAGFECVSVDLLFGLPGQAADTLRASLASAVATRPAHLSCYQLTVHEGTAFGRRRARGRFTEMAEDEQAERHALVHDFLGARGWEAYEVSNFARAPRYRSRHNVKYWRHVPYLGLGPSAHSFDGARRWWNHRALAPYRAALRAGERPVAGGERLTRDELALEALMFGLRSVEGIDLEGFRRRFAVDLIARNRPLVEACRSAGHLRIARGRLVPSASGLAVADALAARFEVDGAPHPPRARPPRSATDTHAPSPASGSRRSGEASSAD